MSKSKRVEQARRERIAAEEASSASAARRRRLQQLGAIAAFAVALVVVLIVVSQGGSDSSGSAPDKGLFNGIAQDGTALGDPNAPFTLVEFGDPQCPFCAEYDRSVLPTVVKDYVRPGKVRLEFQPLTFIGPDSEVAARFAVALGQQNHFWNFIDLMYHNQQTENSGYVTNDFLTGLADQIPGADAKKALAAQGSSEITDVLDKAKSAAQDAGISSTPSFLIGPTGGTATTLDVSKLDPGTFSDALDSAISGSAGG
jgi:protein-disulfide isomerase